MLVLLMKSTETNKGDVISECVEFEIFLPLVVSSDVRLAVLLSSSKADIFEDFSKINRNIGSLYI